MKVDGKKLKAARTKAGASMADVSVVAYLGERRLLQIEAKGARVNMNIVNAICRRLGVKPCDLAED